MKKSDNNILLANTKGQPLKEHSLAVALYGCLILKSLKFKSDKEKKINQSIMLSALLHDIGKVSQSFQVYIKNHINKERDFEEIPTDAESLRRKTFEGPFHNEISWAYSRSFIRFLNQDIRKIVCHSVYWHHPANWNWQSNKLYFDNAEKIVENVEKKLKERTDQLLGNMHNFTENLFKSFPLYYGDSFNLPGLTTPCKSQIQELQCPEFFEHQADKVQVNAEKQLCLNLLLESDRYVSSWTPCELNQFLNEIQNQNISDWSFSKSKQFMEKWRKQPKINKREIFPIVEKLSFRSKEQFDLAEKMSNKQLSVCGVDPAGGKTSIALYWWGKSDNSFPLMISLPRQHQVTGLFYSLEKDCQRIFGKAQIKIEGVFYGKRMHDNWTAQEDSDLLISDINLTVFDRFLSPYYKRSQSSEFIKMLSSHLVLDEFHEFKNLPKMIPSLKEILTIRSWLDSEVKTLMLSGTPEPPLLKLLNVENNNSVFKRAELSPRENHKFKLFYQNKDPENQFIQDCLYSLLRVEDCQKIFKALLKKYQDKIQLIHSYFTFKNKKSLLENILREHGSMNSPLSDRSVVTAKMLQSSYNLNFGKAVLELSQPDTDCQTAGRINRFANKSQAEIRFFYDERTEDFFNENWGAGFKEIHKTWKTYLQGFIEKNRGQTVSMRKLMEFYDDFWTDENIKKYTKVLKTQQEKAIEDLNKYIPKRFLSSGSNKKKSLSLNSLFRGESRLLSACIVNNEGEPVDQLQGEDLLSEGRGWLILKITEAMKNCLKTKEKCKKANNIKPEEFDYNKYISRYDGFGYSVDKPLLSSHFDTDIDRCLEENLKDKDTDNDNTYHRVYHPEFGLVKRSLLKNDR